MSQRNEVYDFTRLEQAVNLLDLLNRDLRAENPHPLRIEARKYARLVYTALMNEAQDHSVTLDDEETLKAHNTRWETYFRAALFESEE